MRFDVQMKQWEYRWWDEFPSQGVKAYTHGHDKESDIWNELRVPAALQDKSRLSRHLIKIPPRCFPLVVFWTKPNGRRVMDWQKVCFGCLLGLIVSCFHNDELITLIRFSSFFCQLQELLSPFFTSCHNSLKTKILFATNYTFFWKTAIHF